MLFLGLWAAGVVFALASGFRKDDTCQMQWNESRQTYDWVCMTHYNRATFAAAASCSWVVVGCAGALMILWLVSFIVVSVFIARHRKGGGHCKVEGETETSMGTRSVYR